MLSVHVSAFQKGMLHFPPYRINPTAQVPSYFKDWEFTQKAQDLFEGALCSFWQVI